MLLYLPRKGLFEVLHIKKSYWADSDSGETLYHLVAIIPSLAATSHVNLTDPHPEKEIDALLNATVVSISDAGTTNGIAAFDYDMLKKQLVTGAL